jgi:hypothetical protein
MKLTCRRSIPHLKSFGHIGVYYSAKHHSKMPNKFNIFTYLLSTYSYCKPDIDHLLRLTDSFTWEDLPIRDPDTGCLTKAGYIPIIQKLTKYAVGLLISFHVIESSVRMVSSHDLILTTWFPFDTSSSPVYVFASITQVDSRSVT